MSPLSEFFIRLHRQVLLLFAKSTWLKSVKIKSLLIALQASSSSITNRARKNSHGTKQKTKGKVDLQFLILCSPYKSLHPFPHNRPVTCQWTHTLAISLILILLQNYSQFITKGENEAEKDKEREKKPAQPPGLHCKGQRAHFQS